MHEAPQEFYNETHAHTVRCSVKLHNNAKEYLR